jgi:hypothetical protein
MIARLFDIFFGCRHAHYSFPFTQARLHPIVRKETYVVCLDCGREFHYDLRTMRMGRKIQQPVLQPDQVFEARRADDEQRAVGRAAQKPLNQGVVTIERKKA